MEIDIASAIKDFGFPVIAALAWDISYSLSGSG